MGTNLVVDVAIMTVTINYVCVCRIAKEKEIHRKISTGGMLVGKPESGTLPEPRLSTVTDGQEGKEEKAVESPTIEQAGHIPKEADGEKVADTVPETARDESKETKESGASDAAGTPTVGKTDVEVNELAKVGQSEVQGEPEGAKAEDVHPQQDTTPEPQATVHKEDAVAVAVASPTKTLELSEDPVAVSTEPEIDGAAAGASLETGKPPEEPSSSAAVQAETEQPPNGGGEVTEAQGSDQPSPSTEPPTVSPSGDSQTNSRHPLLSPSGDSQTESLSYVANSLTEKLLSTT